MAQKYFDTCKNVYTNRPSSIKVCGMNKSNFFQHERGITGTISASYASPKKSNVERCSSREIISTNSISNQVIDNITFGNSTNGRLSDKDGGIIDNSAKKSTISMGDISGNDIIATCRCSTVAYNNSTKESVDINIKISDTDTKNSNDNKSEGNKGTIATYCSVYINRNKFTYIYDTNGSAINNSGNINSDNKTRNDCYIMNRDTSKISNNPKNTDNGTMKRSTIFQVRSSTCANSRSTTNYRPCWILYVYLAALHLSFYPSRCYVGPLQPPQQSSGEAECFVGYYN